MSASRDDLGAEAPGVSHPFRPRDVWLDGEPIGWVARQEIGLVHGADTHRERTFSVEIDERDAKRCAAAVSRGVTVEIQVVTSGGVPTGEARYLLATVEAET